MPLGNKMYFMSLYLNALNSDPQIRINFLLLGFPFLIVSDKSKLSIELILILYCQ
ncbi:MAG: hypothetical protein Ct9H90mP22_7400 [Gammaproteobacteria bacterium]|nr:MAG: hypothetical protein Ct9H90mP22_7400 [Gammaproteobacteria bacterium]